VTGVACGDIARDMFQMRRRLLTQKSSTGEWLCNKGKHKRTEANREACFEQRERVTAGTGALAIEVSRGSALCRLVHVSDLH
jgi:hypothetical protein